MGRARWSETLRLQGLTLLCLEGTSDTAGWGESLWLFPRSPWQRTGRPVPLLALFSFWDCSPLVQTSFFIVEFSLREKRDNWTSSVVLGAWRGALPVIWHPFLSFFWRGGGEFWTADPKQHITCGEVDLGWLGLYLFCSNWKRKNIFGYYWCLFRPLQQTWFLCPPGTRIYTFWWKNKIILVLKKGFSFFQQLLSSVLFFAYIQNAFWGGNILVLSLSLFVWFLFIPETLT